MHTLKHSFQTASAAFSSGDINTTLRAVTKYAWLAAGGLFVCYLYFVGAITFSVIKQETLAQEIKTIISQTSKEELRYLTIQKNLTEGYAKDTGFISAGAVSYTIPTGAFAWNLNARQ